MKTHRKEIDGLRAIAILPVVLFHAGFSIVPGGYAGVDVFFVISGYLITSIIIHEKAKGSFSYLSFLERRARRILPALFFIMLVCIPVAHILLLPSQFKDFAEAAGATALFLSNILFIERLDYFAPDAALNPLLHTWSLAVEEQFYLIFPALLMLAWRLGRIRAALVITVLCLLGSFVLSEAASGIKPAQSFFFFPTRAWELLVGALCAFALHSERVCNRLLALPLGLRQAASLGGLLAVLLTFVIYDSATIFPSRATLLPVLGVAAVILFATSETLVGKVLSVRALVGIGLVSYSAYLWHHPLFAFAKLYADQEPPLAIMFALCMLAFVLAGLTWVFIEQPFRLGQRVSGPVLKSRVSVFAASGTGIAGFVAFGLWGLSSEGRAEYWINRATAIEAQTFTTLERSRQMGLDLRMTACRQSVLELHGAVRDTLLDCFAQHGPGIAVIGDSHAANLISALLSGSDVSFLFGLTRGGCRPGDPDVECNFYAEFAQFVQANPDVFQKVIYETAGQHLLVDKNGRTSERLFANLGPEGAMDLALLQIRFDMIADQAAYLARITPYTAVLWLTPRIEFHFTDSYIIRKGCDYEFELRPGQAQVFDQLAVSIASAESGQDALKVVNQNDILALQMPSDFMTCDRSLWSDGDHLSAAGIVEFGSRLAPALIPDQ